jgi:2-oxoglutarate dehydrogenase E1 component
VNEKILMELGNKIFTIPQNVKAFSKIRKLYENQHKKLINNKIADWAIGEFLAYASILNGGIPIRLCGQDSRRGTFSHRHAVLLNEETEEEYIPLKQVESDTGKFYVYNSLLSEYAALGFEYGYSCANPDGLSIWEAQFGDFANGSQIIFDQFISSAEAKWERLNGIVLYLPHGYEGQGPEHSSARIERYLNLCAKNNMVIANCTMPANFFHLLLRHVKMPFRNPLIILTPKSLLRHPRCISPIKDFSTGGFLPVIDDELVNTENVKKVLLCSGKVYFDLIQRREKIKNTNTAIVRIEQLYPIPMKTIKKILKKYPNTKKVFWVQEEPENMGPLAFFLRKLQPKVSFEYISRRENSSPATGYFRKHLAEHEEILDKAFRE